MLAPLLSFAYKHLQSVPLIVVPPAHFPLSLQQYVTPLMVFVELQSLHSASPVTQTLPLAAAAVVAAGAAVVPAAVVAAGLVVGLVDGQLMVFHKPFAFRHQTSLLVPLVYPHFPGQSRAGALGSWT